MPETFRQEVCNGFDPRMVARALLDQGFLVQKEEGTYTVTTSLPGLRPSRFYIVKSTLLD
jgi:putative DNA primase/helicase